MPPKVEACVESVLEENPEYDESRAWAICKAQHEADVEEPEEIHALADTTLMANGLDELADRRPNEWTRVESEAYGVAWIGQQSGQTIFQAAEERPGDYAYPDAAPDVASPEVKEAVERFREDPDPDTPLLYWLLGTGTPAYKMAKADAEYQDESNEEESCASCEYAYQGTDGSWICSQIAGEIEPEAWCRLFEAVDEPADQQLATIHGLSAEALDAIGRQYNAEIQMTSGAPMSDGGVVVVQADVPDNAVSVSDPSEVPEDARTVTGPRGGLYYVPSEDGGSDGSVSNGLPKSPEAGDKFTREDSSEVLTITDVEYDESQGENVVLYTDESGEEYFVYEDLLRPEEPDEPASPQEGAIQQMSDQITVNLDGLDAPQRDAVVDAFETAFEGELDDAFAVTQLTTTPDEDSEGAAAFYRGRDRQLYIDPEGFEPDAPDPEPGGVLLGSGKWAVVHELGHASHFIKGGAANYGELADQEIPDDMRDRVSEEVSNYATWSPHEFVAEVYTGRKAGIEFSDDIMELYDQYGGAEVSQDG